MTTTEHDPAARWHRLCDSRRVADGAAVGFVVEARPIVVVRDRHRLSAFSGLCTHDLAPLDGARVEDGALVCPRHGARFSLDDGAPAAGFDIASLRRFPVRERGEAIEIDAAAIREARRVEPLQTWDLRRR